jgi:hypothetical protein
MNFGVKSALSSKMNGDPTAMWAPSAHQLSVPHSMSKQSTTAEDCYTAKVTYTPAYLPVNRLLIDGSMHDW